MLPDFVLYQKDNIMLYSKVLISSIGFMGIIMMIPAIITYAATNAIVGLAWGGAILAIIAAIALMMIESER